MPGELMTAIATVDMLIFTYIVLFIVLMIIFILNERYGWIKRL